MTQMDLLAADLDRDTAVRAGDEELVLRAANVALSRAYGSEPVRPSGVHFRPSSRRRRQVATALVAAALISVSGLAAALFAGVIAVPFKGRLAEKPEEAPLARAPVTALPAAPKAALEPSVVNVPENVPENVLVASPRAVRATPEAALGASDLFRGANAARRGGDLARARRLYSELIQKYPSSDEARLAQVSLGKLLLSEGKSREAEREFSRYLAGGQGPLAEEALVSQAQSLERLERVSEERAAWQRLVSEHPNSVYAAQARERLKVLSSGVKSGR